MTEDKAHEPPSTETGRKNTDSMRKRIWIRVGGYIYGTEEELQALIRKNEEQDGLSPQDIEGMTFVPDGDAYIPDDMEIEDDEEQ